MEGMEEVIAEFLMESREGLDHLDSDLVALEESPEDDALLSRIFRCVHTVKGTSGFLGYAKLEALTHRGESLLGRMRDGDLTLDDAKTSALLAMVDAIRSMLDEVEVGGSDGDGDYSALTETLRRLAEEDFSAVASGDGLLPTTDGGTSQTAAEHHPRVASGAHRHEGHPANDTVRVDVGLLDHLMDFAGELVLTRNQILQLPSTRGDTVSTAAAQRLNLITVALQEGIMRMRMQPVDGVFSKFPRVVRDLARACKKLVRVELDGRNTELDKTLVAAVRDPLTHLLRNAVDHGIEPPHVRQQNGKPAEGRIMVRAFHRGGQVNIEICDDGGGIPLDRVKAKALSRGLVTPEQVAGLSEAELTGLIFLPGFSTAETITTLSGRGVGMDVVKTNIESIGGTVEVETELGKGTTFRLRIPLTLAIVPALLITSGPCHFAIPQVNLLELVRLEEGRNGQSIEHIHGAAVYRLRGKLLPLVFLDQHLGYAEVPDQGSSYIVVLQASGCSYGLVVQNVRGQQEIVVKPLPAQVKDLGIYAGATILGDGRVALILDVLGLAQRAHVVGDSRDRLSLAKQPEAPTVNQPQCAYLLFRGPNDGHMAVPLNSVTRLEIFPRSTFAPSGQYDVVQYRNDIMPVVSIEQVVTERRSKPRSPVLRADLNAPDCSVIVFRGSGAYVGLAVNDICDIVDGPTSLSRAGVRPGVVGTVVIQEKIAEVIDLEYVMCSVLGPEKTQATLRPV